jgi:uncharacterized protein YkwD
MKLGTPHRVLATIVACAFAAGILGAPIYAPRSAGATATVDACLDEVEVEFLQLVNAYRREHGVTPLKSSQTLTAASDHHSWSMGTYNYFSHDLAPENTNWSDNMTNHGYTANTWRAENIPAGQVTAVEVFEAWKASPGHNSTMLSDKFNAIGIGRTYTEGSYYSWYWTTDFGGYVDGGATACGGGDLDDEAGGQLPQQATAPYHIKHSFRSGNSNKATYAIDHKPSTAWHTAGSAKPSSAFMVVDLGSIKHVSRIAWMFKQIGYADGFRLAVSNNKTDWNVIASPGNAAAPMTWQSLNYDGNARYIRFAFDNSGGDQVIGFLGEVRIFP